ncbi:RNA polymerase sigma factor [Pseudonocardia sp. TRM90224]|uniref:RNA polymerase sigma factor n=1 Tax=Pseudonocardia sp. TRM90224 TaxID=2812678 RepID=UPI001E51FD87|nr:sigma factor [Pseudonocardia sp. TRM90224]
MRHPDSTSDAAIIAASMSEPARFAAIFDRHAPSIHGYLTGRLGRQAAEDLVGETFLVAFDRRARFDVRVPSARPWLYGIATRLVAQHRREHARDVRLRLVTSGADGRVPRPTCRRARLRAGPDRRLAASAGTAR